jgi:hypothetical protein
MARSSSVGWRNISTACHKTLKGVDTNFVQRKICLCDEMDGFIEFVVEAHEPQSIKRIEYCDTPSIETIDKKVIDGRAIKS